jgi:hypothetical protein
VTEAEIDAARDRTGGRPMREALRDAGLAGRPRVTHEPERHVGYLEAHIEQGDTLEAGGLAIGVVTSIVGIWEYRITFIGEQNHAGTTRMAVRKDAGLALARFCVAIDDRFPALAGPRTVWTVGRITLDPGAPSIIPGRAEMMLQIRDSDPAVIARLENLLQTMAAEVTAEDRCSVTAERLRTGAPALMEPAFQDAVEAASAACAGGRSVRMPSGAGHDAQILATVMPPSLDREHQRRRHRHRRAGLRRRLPAHPSRLAARLRHLHARSKRPILTTRRGMHETSTTIDHSDRFRAAGQPDGRWHICVLGRIEPRRGRDEVCDHGRGTHYASDRRRFPS